jgi:predicted DNA-binding transcriptional regulator AlpA
MTKLAADAPLALDRSAVARLLGVSLPTLARLVRREGFPAPRLLAGPAGTRRYLLHEVQRWLESRPAAPGGTPARLKGSRKEAER